MKLGKRNMKKNLHPYLSHMTFFITLLIMFFCAACTVKHNTVVPKTSTNLPLATIIPTTIPANTPSPEATLLPTQPAAPTQPPTVTPLPTVSTDLAADTLRAYAAQQGKLIGVAVNNGLVREAEYAEVLAREFNLLTTENAMKWSLIQPERYRYDWAGADELVNFAIANGMKVRGHTLIWQQQMPDWLKYQDWSREELLTIMKEHITNVVGRYRGRVDIWDVVNEAIIQKGVIFTPFWSKRLGTDYIDLAFQMAHEADPDALLFYNDYNADDMGVKSDGVYALVKGMKERGIPIDGVGMQFHIELNYLPKLDEVSQNMKRLGELGLQVHITELDIRIKGSPTPELLEQQAQNYRDILNVCLNEPNCTAFIMWGMTDKYSWIPQTRQGYGSALIFDENYQPKPAYQALLDALKLN
jgi:endo-1,4-beta-xylanase